MIVRSFLSFLLAVGASLAECPTEALPAFEKLLNEKIQGLQPSSEYAVPFSVLLSRIQFSAPEVRILKQRVRCLTSEADRQVTEKALKALRAGVRLAFEQIDPQAIAAEDGLELSRVSKGVSDVTGELAAAIALSWKEPSILFIEESRAVVGAKIASRAFKSPQFFSVEDLNAIFNRLPPPKDIAQPKVADAYVRALRPALADGFLKNLKALDSDMDNLALAAFLEPAVAYIRANTSSRGGSSEDNIENLLIELRDAKQQSSHLRTMITQRDTKVKELADTQLRLSASMERFTNRGEEMLKELSLNVLKIQKLRESAKTRKLTGEEQQFITDFERVADFQVAKITSTRREMEKLVSSIKQMPSTVFALPNMPPMNADSARQLIPNVGLPFTEAELTRLGETVLGRLDFNRMGDQVVKKGINDLKDVLEGNLKGLKADILNKIPGVDALLSGNFSGELSELFAISNPLTAGAAQGLMQALLANQISGKLDEITRTQQEILNTLARVEQKLDEFRMETRQSLDEIKSMLREIQASTFYTQRLLTEYIADDGIEYTLRLKEFTTAIATGPLEPAEEISKTQGIIPNQAFRAILGAALVRDANVRQIVDHQADVSERQMSTPITMKTRLGDLYGLLRSEGDDGLRVPMRVKAATSPSRHVEGLTQVTSGIRKVEQESFQRAKEDELTPVVFGGSLVSPARTQMFVDAWLKLWPYYMYLDSTWTMPATSGFANKASLAQELTRDYIRLTNIGIAQWAILSGDVSLDLLEDLWNDRQAAQYPKPLRDGDSILQRNFVLYVLRKRLGPAMFADYGRGKPAERQIEVLNRLLVREGMREVRIRINTETKVPEINKYEACIEKPGSVGEKQFDICVPLPTQEEMARGLLYWHPGVNVLLATREKLIRALAQIQAPEMLSSEDRSHLLRALVLAKAARAIAPN